ncbi:hypothetical protein ACHMW6_23030 [Pseudoduganella sp. UC29_106]|uniref:hypothetical protein n=1 Tax=Pseudoduganella sp. UC29_106 TaxID=3374553 RepID=UPI0037575127
MSSRHNAYGQLEYFFDLLVKEKEGLVIDGSAPFKSGDKFLPGRIAAAPRLYLLTHMDKGDPRLSQRLADYRAIAEPCLRRGRAITPRGIYYYLGALYRLKQAGLLEQAVSPRESAGEAAREAGSGAI